MQTRSFSEVRSATAAATRALDQRLNWRRGEAGDGWGLLDYVRSRVPTLAGVSVDDKKLREAHEISEAARQSCGQAPDGLWVPLQALRRDLLTATAGSLTQSAMLADTLARPELPPSVLIGNGATVLGGLSGATFSMPRIDAGIDMGGVAWIGEGSTGPQSEPTFDTRTLTPRTVTIEMLVSRKLLLQSSVDLEAELRAELLRRFLAELDRVGLAGDGVLEPLGLLNDPEVDTLEAGPNGAAPTWAHLVDAEHAVTSRMHELKAPAWVMSSALRKKLRTTARGSGLDYILTGGTLLDYRVSASTTVPSDLTKGSGTDLSALLFGDLSEVVVGFWGPVALDVLVDGVTLAKDGRVRIVARADVDIVARQPAALVSYADFVTT